MVQEVYYATSLAFSARVEASHSMCDARPPAQIPYSFNGCNPRRTTDQRHERKRDKHNNQKKLHPCSYYTIADVL